MLSACYHLDSSFTPLHNYGDLFLMPRKIPDSLKSKVLIVYRNEDRKLIGKTTHWEGKFLTTKIRDFGDYYVAVDTVPPQILATGIRQNQIMKGNELDFKITDNLSGIKSYNVYLDGKWYLAEYDAKSDGLSCNVDDSVQKGAHILKVVVTDDVNNTKTFLLNFSK